MKNTRQTLIALSLATVMALSTSLVLAQAQGGGPGRQGQGGPGGAGGPGMRRMAPPGLIPLAQLIQRPEIREELNLTQSQGERIRSILEENRPQPGAERPSRQQIEAHRAKIDGLVLSVLDQAQAKRARELQIQVSGPSAVFDPGVQASLKITLQQKAALDALLPQPPSGGNGGFRQGEPGQGRVGPGGDRPGPRGGDPGQGERGRGGGPGGDRRDLDRQILEILTQGQKDQLRTMGGEPL